MTLYRNENTGDVFDTADNPDMAADLKARPNWHRVTKDESQVEFGKWTPRVDEQPDAPEVTGLLEDGLIPRDGKPSSVDVPQSGPTGSKARGNLAPDKPTRSANTGPDKS